MRSNRVETQRAGCAGGHAAGGGLSGVDRDAARVGLVDRAQRASDIAARPGADFAPRHSGLIVADAPVSSPPASSAPPTVTTAPPAFTATAIPLPSVLAAEAGKDVVRLPTDQHVVALTFDAGANADAIPEILATLQAEDVPGTFFLTGAWVKAFPGQARQIGALYPVGNHSSTHPHFTQLSAAAVSAQVTDAQTAITAAAGHNPQPLFRFPFGDRDTRTRQLVNSLGYISILWTVDTLGWEGTSGGQTTSSVVHRVLAKLEPGEIVLMHVGSNPVDHSTLDGDSLKKVIEAVKAAGYGFVTVPQGLGLP